jgi:hypothetical protein
MTTKLRLEDEEPASGLSRRRFLSGLGAAATVAATGLSGLEPAAAAAPAALPEDLVEKRGGHPASAGEVRRTRAWQVRRDANEYWKRQPVLEHPTNGDEARYPNRLGNYSKSLPHNSFGEVDATAYSSLLRAMETAKPADFDDIVLAGPNRLTSPQGGLSCDLEGADSFAIAVPPPPALASAEMAGEGVELYWASLLRDVNFLEYGSHPDAVAACADLNRFGADFKGAKLGGKIYPRTLFRDPLPGALSGPYISQFMWLNTPFGAEYVERRMRTRMAGTDHLTNYGNWLATQNGQIVESMAGTFDPERRYIRNGRDLARWVHMDVLFQAYFNACLILMAPPSSDAESSGIGCPVNPGNPYVGNATQIGFTTFGPPHIKALMCEVASRALKVTWHKKWQVHRRLRPEAWGGRVHNQVVHGRYPGVIHGKQLDSPVLGRVHEKFGSYLLPMAFPEGSPTHPSYTAGHATVAGACVTILKAMFDERHVIPEPVVPTPDGLSLVPYTGPDLTVGGELNKLASNIATGRNLGGVHWRSDARESLRAGEALAISILRDQRGTYNEDFHGFTFTRFDGSTVTV